MMRRSDHDYDEDVRKTNRPILRSSARMMEEEEEQEGGREYHDDDENVQKTS